MNKWRAVPVLLAPLLAAACATATIEDAVPQGALASAEARTPAAEFAPPGAYPNLNINPQPAASQLTDSQTRAEAAALRERRQRQASDGGGVQDRSEELRRLARSHADAALEEIERQ